MSDGNADWDVKAVELCHAPGSANLSRSHARLPWLKVRITREDRAVVGLDREIPPSEVDKEA